MKHKRNLGERQKLMDRLPPDPSLGRLIGIVATTYELQPEFFETDFLPTLLGLGGWDDRNWTSRIALEKQLAELEGASLLTDARPYRGRPRSLRVEVVPVFLHAGRILHAKVLVSVYEDAVRLTFGSANLTEPGYRRNHEVAAVLTASLERPAEAQLVLHALREMRQLLGRWMTPSALGLCELAGKMLQQWVGVEKEQEQWFVWGGHQVPLWQRFVERWPSGDRVEGVTIVSPFWSDEAEQGPVDNLISAMRERECLAPQVKLRLLTEAAPENPGTWRPKLPASFATFNAASCGASAEALAVDPRVAPEEVGKGVEFSGLRTLHAKVVLLEGSEASLAYFGSANFTQRGWGFCSDPNKANIEAGLIVRRFGSRRDALQVLIPATIGEPVALDGAAANRLAPPEPSPDELPWPGFLLEIVLVPSDEYPHRLELVAVVDPASIKGTWRIEHLPAEDEPAPSALLVDGGDSRRVRFRIEVEKPQLDRLLRDQEVHVKWWHCDTGRAFPVNVDAAARTALPIGPGSGRPEECHLIAYYQGRITWEELFPDPLEDQLRIDDGAELDQSNGVDTTRIQSYIVREFVEALKGITDDLRAAAQSPKACMRLALLGSVSPVALAHRVLQAAEAGQRTATATGFQLVEILGCLDVARTFPASDRLCKEWIELIDEATQQVQYLLEKLRQRFPNELSGNFRRYSTTVRKHYKNMVSTQ